MSSVVFESLERRTHFSVTAVFAPVTGVLNVTGDNASNAIVVSRDAAGRILVNGGTVNVSGGIATVANTHSIAVSGLGGNDALTLDQTHGALPAAQLNGGAGNDTLTGGDGNDLLIGGDGNDLVIGGRGSDVAQMGAGDDTFVWNPGDGSDVIDGQGGNDTMQFNGASVAEGVSLSAIRTHLHFTRDVANIAMDTVGVENVNFKALGGADVIRIGDLSATDVKHVNLDLASPAGSGTGDGAVDFVNVFGSNGNVNDHIQIAGAGSSYSVTGLSETVSVTGSEATDQLTVTPSDGNSIVNAQGLAAVTTHLTVVGGHGNDTITGGQGNDMLLGGDGNDVIIGGPGHDTALLGTGDDTFIWNPGDGSDIIEGQAGDDTMLFNGANVAEKVDIAANGTRLRFTRDVANIVMDADGIENVNFRALGGADAITVEDLAGTAVTAVNLDLGSNGAGGGGAGDGSADTVIVNGTAGKDVISASGTSGAASLKGLATLVRITNAEAANDRLIVRGNAGDDVVEASNLGAHTIQFSADGGAGNDVLIGSAGNDTLTGDAGDDLLIGGPGNDLLDGGTGNNVLIQ
ncbi:MAG TPA: calcium-binding protein [Humisphaera sp.]|jgi:Ca2+-binding RTX toxin-like protein|nr:calcium-binding protein [Humisphaera sp.]